MIMTKLLKRRYVITFVSVVLVFLVFSSVYLFKNASYFLSLNHPIEAKIMVVEGWIPDYALEKAKFEFEKGGYQMLITTGGPLSKGFFLSDYGTHAELAAATLIATGFPNDKLSSVSAQKVKKDRTYASAVALKRWLVDNNIKETNFNVVSLGTHARRTRLLFKKAFDGEYSIGIIAIENEDYNSRKWWKSSSGVRSVLNELIAYCYASFFFRDKN